MYGTAAYCQHQREQEMPKRLGYFGLVFPVDPHNADVFAVTREHQAMLEGFTNFSDGKSMLAYTMLTF